MRIGLVVPTAEDRVPAEGAVIYPDVTFVPKGTGVASLTPEGYDKAVDKIVPAADALAAQGVDAIMLFGTSLTFYRGPQFNEDLQNEVRARTKLPVSSMSSAIVEGLREVRAKRLAVATAYSKVVNDKLIELLEFHGFEVNALNSFGITEFGGAVSAKTEDEIVALAGKSRAEAPRADGIVISCGGLRTLGVTKPLEDKHGLPVVSSTPASFWAAVRLAGHPGRVSGYGRLLEGATAAAK
jgi:arylmalonate decarboxylase